MNDTPQEVQARFAELMAARSSADRVGMMFSMLATAKAIVASSIRAATPDITDADLKAAIFERMYASDFLPEELAVIRARIRDANR